MHWTAQPHVTLSPPVRVPAAPRLPPLLARPPSASLRTIPRPHPCGPSSCRCSPTVFHPSLLPVPPARCSTASSSTPVTTGKTSSCRAARTRRSTSSTRTRVRRAGLLPWAPDRGLQACKELCGLCRLLPALRVLRLGGCHLPPQGDKGSRSRPGGHCTGSLSPRGGRGERKCGNARTRDLPYRRIIVTQPGKT